MCSFRQRTSAPQRAPDLPDQDSDPPHRATLQNTLSELKVVFQDCLQEYFDSCDTEEVIRSIEELQCEEHHSELVKKAVSIRLDEHPREQ